MKKYRLIVDSGCDLPSEMIKDYDIDVTPLIVTIGEKQYKDGVDITSVELIKQIEDDNAISKTSALSVLEIADAFKKNLAEYEHIFYLPISSQISSNYNNARLAIQALEQEDRITLLDPLNITCGQGLLALGICRDFKRGMDPDTIKERHDKRVKRVVLKFVLDKMEYLHRGGRCSGLAYLIGNAFKIHPIIDCDEGSLGIYTLVRGKNIWKGLKKICDEFEDDFANNRVDLNYPIFIPHVLGDDYVKDLIKELQGRVTNGMLIPVEVSCVITSHVGPDTVGLSYMKKKNLN